MCRAKRDGARALRVGRRAVESTGQLEQQGYAHCLRNPPLLIAELIVVEQARHTVEQQAVAVVSRGQCGRQRPHERAVGLGQVLLGEGAEEVGGAIVAHHMEK